MAKLTIFIVVIVALVVKDGAFSCSLRSHKDKSGSSLCSDLTTTPHHLPDPRPHKTSICDLSCKSSSSTSNVSPGLPNVSTSPFKPTYTSGTPLSVPTSVLPSSLVSSVFYQAVLNNLIQLLLSLPTRITSSTSNILPSPSTTNTSMIPGQINTSSHCTPITSSNSYSPTVLPSLSCGSVLSSGGSTIPGQVLKPNILSSPCASSSTLPSTLMGSPYSSISPSTVNSTQGLQSPPTTTSGLNLTNLIKKLSSLIIKPTAVPTPKLSSSSPPCPLITPAINNHRVPESVVKSHNKSFIRKPSSGVNSCLSNVLPDGLQREPSSSTKITVPTAVLVLTSETNPEPAPEEFPMSIRPPVPDATSNVSNFSGHYPTVINLLHKFLFPNQTPNVTSVPLPSTLQPLFSFTTSTSNITPTPPSVLKPSNTSYTSFATSSNDSLSPTKSNQDSVIPLFTSVPTSGVSSGYNPNYMKLLINYLLSTPISPSPTQSPSNLTTSPIKNILSTSTSNITLSEPNPNVSDVTKSNKTSNSAPVSVIIPNTSCKSSYGSLSYIICKLESLGYGPNLSSGLPSPIPATPTDENKYTNTETPMLTPCPPLPLSGLDKCRLKHSRLPKLPASSSSVDPLAHSIFQLHTPTLSPCSSHSKLSSGCKH